MAACRSGRVDQDIFQAILQGSDPNAVDDHGMTALMHAPRSGCARHVESLLPVCDAAVKGKKGRDALAVALSDDYWTRDRAKRERRAYDETLALLVDCCDLSWRSERGEDIPELLAELGMSSAIEKLAESGRLAPGKSGVDTPLIAAARAGRHDTVSR